MYSNKALVSNLHHSKAHAFGKLLIKIVVTEVQEARLGGVPAIGRHL